MKGYELKQRTKPDYELKSKVLKTDFPRLAKEISFSKFTLNGELLDDVLAMENELLKNDYYKEAVKINKANYKKKGRLEHRITKMLEKNCLFLTFTFTDDVLEKTSPATRRQYVFRWLKERSDFYVANVDFGSQNGREHYHAIIQIERIDATQWKYGALNLKKIKTSSDSVKLAKYITKLTNHAIKETTRRNAIIYSRKLTTTD